MRAAIALILAIVSCHAGLARADGTLTLTAIDSRGGTVSSLIDGNTVRLRAALPATAAGNTEVTFRLDGHPDAIASCTIVRGASACLTAGQRTLGWYWDAQGQARPERVIHASTAQDESGAALPLRIAPRPIVLVHGFMSDHTTWAAYTTAGGLLAPYGLRGFAVGDGHAPGRLSTGNITRPTHTTKTLPENAAALGHYIAGVKTRTGAEMVDLLAHSMGGLMSRYYIARLMPVRDVAQLIMLGSPHGGSECSALAIALGVLGPAAFELRPAFLRQIFNRTVTRRNGVPFHMLAGDLIVEGFKAPCTGVASDGVVSVDSAGAIPGTVSQLPVLHTDMTSSPEVFARFVLPLLQRPAGTFPDEGDPLLVTEGSVPAQFTQVFTGRVERGASTEVVVNLDQVAIASFALFDPSRSLEVTVRGASGQVITLSAQQHGLIKVDDPSSLLTLGYGFRNPRPGPWRVTLQAPPEVATDFALSARVVGGATLQARAVPLAPVRGQAVELSATLVHPQGPLTDVSMRAVVRRPDGKTETLELQGGGAERSAVWRAADAGIHGIDIVASAQAPGSRLERTAFLAVDVQP